MTPAVRKEYDIMAAELASMYGAKWDKDATARKMVVQAAKTSARNNARIGKLSKQFGIHGNDIRETCMKLSTYLRCPLYNILTLCEEHLRLGTSWDQFVCFVDKETGAVRRDGE